MCYLKTTRELKTFAYVGDEISKHKLALFCDADFAGETAALTRSQILVSASTNILSLANQAPNSALQLLG